MITTRAQRAARFPEEYREGFWGTPYWEGGWPNLTPPKPPARVTYDLLKALGEHPDPDTVDHIMGHRVTFATCNECGQDADVAAFFDINCGEFDVELCVTCCRYLAYLIQGAR